MDLHEEQKENARLKAELALAEFELVTKRAVSIVLANTKEELRVANEKIAALEAALAALDPEDAGCEQDGDESILDQIVVEFDSLARITLEETLPEEYPNF